MELIGMREEEKIRFCLAVAEETKRFVGDGKEKALLEKAIGKCREWAETGKGDPNNLYDCLDDEENGLSAFQERAEDETKAAAWDCGIDAVAFICAKAYSKAGAKYLPESIEAVDDGVLEHMTKAFLLCGGSEDRLKELLQESVAE